MDKLISVSEADRLIDGIARECQRPAISVPLAKAIGRILRRDVVADRDYPPFDRATMDGYALSAADISTGETLHIAGEAPAGEERKRLTLHQSICLGIATGAPLPIGADTVVPVEDVEVDGEEILIKSPSEIRRGQNIHARGSDCTMGKTLLSAGMLLGAAEIGIAASVGSSELLVNQRPRIAIVSSGDELVEVDQNPEPHQIRRSNPAALNAALTLRGNPAKTLLALRDDEPSTRDGLNQLVEDHDLIITIGGISKGKRDFIAPTLNTLGARIFHGLAQKPGSPLGLWRLGHATVFALPGNPVSALLCLHRFVFRWLDLAAGTLPRDPPKIVLGGNISSLSGRRRRSATNDRLLTFFLPVTIESDRAVPVPFKNSGDFLSLAGSDGFFELPTHEKFEAGHSFPFYPWQKT